MSAVPFNVGQNSTITLNSPAQIATVSGDNATPFYLHFPSFPPGMQWVFPFTYGFSYPLDQFQQNPRCTTSDTPPGFPVSPTATSLATLIAYDYALPYSGGRTVPQLGTDWKAVGSFTTVGAGSEFFITQAVPPGTQSLGINIAGAKGIGGLTIWGLPGLELYASALSNQVFGNFQTVLVNGGLSQTFHVGWNVSSGAGTLVEVFASPIVAPTTPFATPIVPWVAPNLGNLSVTAVGATTTNIVAAVAGQTCYVFGGEILVYVAVAGFASLTDTSGGVIASCKTDNIGSFPFQRNGGASPVGLGLQLTNSAAASSRCSLSASQA